MAKREAGGPELGERLWLAALGKHPGWNDHLDDIGLDTDRLVAVRRTLYVDGIGGVIGAGTWEAMDDASRDEGFAHSFLWRQPDGLVVGRMWSSSDGKGRRKYPMIVCAQCRMLPLAFVAGPVLDRLRRLEARCQAVSTAAEVISAVDAMRGELRELATFTPELAGERFEGEAAPAALADAEALGPEGVGLRRVLYQMEREMSAYLRPEGTVTGSRSRTLEVRAQHMRVPKAFETEHASWSAWMRLLLNRVDQLAPILLVCKDGREWVDVIVGEPGVSQLACLQGSTEPFPLTSDIPFTIDDEHEKAFGELVDRARAGELPELDPGYVDASSDRLAPFLKAARRKTEPTASKSRKQLLWASIAAVAVLAVVVVLAMVFFRGGGKQSTSRGGEPEATGNERTVASAPAPGAEQTPAVESGAGNAQVGAQFDEFRRWCRLAGSWYLPFVEQINAGTAAGDADLDARLRRLIAAPDGSGFDPNPLNVAPGRFRSLEALESNPPADMGEAKYRPAIEKALAHITAVQKAIGPDAWRAHRALRTMLDLLGTESGRAPQALAAMQTDLASDRGEEAARGVSSLAARAGPIEQVADALRSRAVVGDALRDAGAGEQAGWFEAIDPTGGGAQDDVDAWLESTVRRATKLKDWGDVLVDTAVNRLPRIDKGGLAAAMAGVSEADPERRLKAWLEKMGDDSLYPLDSSKDPRKVLAAGDLDKAVDGLNSVRNNGGDGAVAELAREAEAWRSDFASASSLGWTEATRAKVERAAADLTARRADLLSRIDTLVRERRYKAESYLAELKGKTSVSETGSAAIDGAWVSARNALIERFDKDSDLVGLTRDVESLRAAIAAVETQMPVVTIDPTRFGEAGERVAGLVADEREARLGEAASRYEQPAGAQKAAAAYQTWASGVAEAAALSGAMLDACGGWATLDDAAGGESLRDAMAAWNKTWVGQRVGLGQIDKRLGLLEGQVAPGDRGELAATIADTSAADGVVYAAWSALEAAKPAWPGDIDELTADAAVIQRLRGAVSTLPATRRAVIDNALAAGAAARWTRVAATPDGWDAFRPLVPLADELGLSGGTGVPSELGFDLLVAGLLDRIEGGKPLDKEGMLASVEAWLKPDAGLGGNKAATEWLDSLRETLEGRPSVEVDPRSIGPGRAGWAAEAFDNARRLKYTLVHNGQPGMSLGFRLVDTPETGAFYLGETEAPVALMLDFALAGGDADLVLGTIEPDWASLGGDIRPGPCTWTWGRLRTGGRGVQLNGAWTSSLQTAGVEYYAPSLREKVGDPTEASPLQRIRPAAAAVVAALVGCRLPSVAEWQAAYVSMDSPVPGDEWNLRDRTFGVQRAYMAEQTVVQRWPDEGAFVGEGEDGPRGRDAANYDWSDERLWFEDVGAGRERAFRHIIGNVAEYVLAGAGPDALLTDRFGDLRELASGAASAASKAGVVSVIGGSALSPPDVPINEPRAMPSTVARSGYSDVGFRLAFSPGVKPPLIVEVGGLLRSAPFLRRTE
ncbi:MAG: hypothetical protein H6810_13045 [Phycisphaeraceae bacterium]|nr:MAG: hypothetical protein H6810_13045 [Phycisphaeraceae bacterium]